MRLIFFYFLILFIMFATFVFLWANCVLKNSVPDKKYFFMLEKKYHLCYANKNINFVQSGQIKKE